MMENLLEMLIVSVISAGITAYVNIKVIKEQFAEMKEEWHHMRIRLHDIEDWIAGQKAVAELKKMKGEL